MAYIYLDESGDLGFDFSKSGTSRHFLIALLLVINRRPVTSLVKKTFLSLPHAAKRNNSGILHAHHEKDITATRLLRALAQKSIRIAVIRLDKSKILIADNPNELYANMVTTLINRLYSDGVVDKDIRIDLIADVVMREYSMYE